MIKFSLNKKINTIVVATIFVFGFVASLSVFYYSRSIFIEQKKENLVFLLEGQSHEIAQIFDFSKKEAKNFAKDYSVMSFLVDNNRKVQDPVIVEKIKSHNLGESYLAVVILDDKGDVVAAHDSSFVGENYSFREFFSEALKGNSYIDVYVGATSGQLGYYFSHPVISDDRVVGTVVFKLNPDVVNDSLHVNRLWGKELDFMIVDDYGVVNYSNNQDLVLKGFFDLSNLEKDQIVDKRKFSYESMEYLNYGIVREDVISLSTGKINLSDGDFVAFSQIPNTRFYTIIKTNYLSIFGGVLYSPYILAFLILFCALFAALIISSFISYFVKPVEIINEIVKKVSGGDLSQRIDVKSNDEFSDLAQNINKLVVNLEKNIKDVESKEGERTNQLEKVNNSMVGRELKMIELKKEILDLRRQLEGGNK